MSNITPFGCLHKTPYRYQICSYFYSQGQQDIRLLPATLFVTYTTAPASF